MRDDNGLMSDTDDYVIREFVSCDEPSWLRCRVLSFLPTAYFDDVVAQKAPLRALGFELVAVDVFGTVMGLMDIVADGAVGAIDSLAVHPDHQHRGIAQALLARTIEQARRLAITELSAWTRDDPAALSFYRAAGFAETDHYLHVFASRYADGGELDGAFDAMSPGLHLVSAFFHADMEDEIELRQKFSRVHVCRRFTKAL